MSATLKSKAKKTGVIQAKYIGESEYNGETVHLVFVHHVIAGEKHVYDSMYMFKGKPTRDYSKYELLTEGIDFDATYTVKGFPTEFRFREVA